MDHYTFDPLGRWDVDRGEQKLGYDFAWYLGYDVAVTGKWGTPDMVENGVIPEELLAGKYGHSFHFFVNNKNDTNSQTLQCHLQSECWVGTPYRASDR